MASFRSLWRLITLLLTVRFSLQSCSSEEDCSLNGVCQKSQCVCDPGWRSDDCGELDLQPTPRKSGYNRTAEGISSWGSRIVRDPDDSELFHLFASEFPGGCGLEHWTPFSRIIRAESRTGPLGPYQFAQEVVGAFAHNPTVIFDPVEQLYVMYHIGCPVTLPSSCSHMVFTCGAGNDLNGESGIVVATSPDLRTWTPRGEVFSTGGNGTWDETVTNPSAFVIEDGAAPGNNNPPHVILAYRGCPYNCNPYPPYGPELISIASAPHYAGPYMRLDPGPLFDAPNEDPFIWRDRRGNFHMLLHSLEQGGGFGDGPNVGRHAYASSWEGPWVFNDRTLAFNTTAVFTDGTSVEYNRRERPQLFFSQDGEMTPLYMTNGVQEKGKESSYTLIVPIGRDHEGYENSQIPTEYAHEEL